MLLMVYTLEWLATLVSVKCPRRKRIPEKLGGVLAGLVVVVVAALVIALQIALIVVPIGLIVWLIMANPFGWGV